MCQQEDSVVTYCIDCALFLCHNCDGRQHPTNQPRSHRMVPLTKLRTKGCTLTDHNGHPCYPIEVVVEKHKDELKEATGPIEEISRSLSKA